MSIITDEYLRDELGLSGSFINKHASRMGAFSRPRRYFLENVMSHLHGLAEAKIKKSGIKTLKKAMDKASVLRLVDETFKRHGVKGRKTA